MKLMGFIKEEDNLCVLKDGEDIYICQEDMVYPVIKVGKNRWEEDSNRTIKEVKIGEDVEPEEWLVVLSKKNIEKIASMI